MATPAQAARLIRFGAYEVDLRASELRKNGRRVKLQDQPFQVLCLLLERPGELVTREELRQKLWPADTFVDFDNGLNTAIKKLRDTLADSAETPRYIETVPRRGYRFTCPVNGGATEPATPTAAGWLRHSRALLLAGGGLAVAVLLVVLNVGGLRERILGPRFTGPVDSVAVLPFNNLTGNAEQEYLADGLTDVLTTELAQVGKLRVPSVTTAMSYKQQKKKLPEIASELRVTAVVEGSVQWRGEQILVNVQLVHGPTDRHMWARSYEGAPKELPTLLARVARDVLSAMSIQLSEDEKARLAAERPVNREAYEAYLRARHLQNKGTELSRAKAVEYYQEAINKDPGFASPYGSLAMIHGHGGFYLSGLSLAESKSKARELASKALELDPTLATAHLALATSEKADWDWAGAEREFRLALELEPNNAIAHDWYAQHLANLRRFDEAIAHAETARRLSPTDPASQVHAGIVYYEAGRADEAMAIWRSVLELEPDYWAAHHGMGRAYIVKGEYLKAIPHFETSIRVRVKDGPSWAQMGYAYARAGDREGLRKVLEEFKKKRTDRRGLPHQGIGWYQLQYIYLGLGENDKVIAILEERFERHGLSIGINSDPFFDPIRTDPRLHDLLRRMGIPEENIGKRPMNPLPAPAKNAAQLRAMVP